MSLKSKAPGPQKPVVGYAGRSGPNGLSARKSGMAKTNAILPRTAFFRLDDAKHNKSLRWRDGNHGDWTLPGRCGLETAKGAESLHLLADLQR